MSPKQKPIITEEEWLFAVLDASRPNDAGRTMREWAEYWGISVFVANERIRKAHKSGYVVAGRRAISRIDGVGGAVPVYRIVRKEE